MDNSKTLSDLRNLFQVQKTITFELKAFDKYDPVVHFEKTKNFIENEYFKQTTITDGIPEIKQLVGFGTSLLSFSQDFSINLEKGNMALRAFEVDKKLIEICDRELYHTLKKKTPTKRDQFPTNRNYIPPFIWSDRLNLASIEKSTEAKTSFISVYLNKLNARLSLFLNKIQSDLATIYSKQTETEKVLYFESGKVVFYANVKALLGIIKDEAIIFKLVSKSDFDCENDPNWNKTSKIIASLEGIQKQYASLENICKTIDEVVNEEAKKPIILTSLNPRAVNKDQKKIDAEWQKVQELEEEIEKLETDLSAINENKRDVVEKLEWALKKKYRFTKNSRQSNTARERSVEYIPKSKQGQKSKTDGGRISTSERV